MFIWYRRGSNHTQNVACPSWRLPALPSSEGAAALRTAMLVAAPGGAGDVGFARTSISRYPVEPGSSRRTLRGPNPAPRALPDGLCARKRGTAGPPPLRLSHAGLPGFFGALGPSSCQTDRPREGGGAGAQRGPRLPLPVLLSFPSVAGSCSWDWMLTPGGPTRAIPGPDPCTYRCRVPVRHLAVRDYSRT